MFAKKLALAAFVALIAVSGVVAEDVDESNVLVLTSENFDQTIADNEHVLVEFYAPWCGHCKRLIAPYAAAATALAAKGSPVKLAKVDATENSELASKFGVRGYPTLKWFSGSPEPSDYNGPREEAGIIQWVEKKSGPASTELSGADAVAAFVEGKAAVVGQFKSTDSDAYKTYLTAAKSGKLDDFAFAHFTGAEDKITLYTAHAEPQVADASDLESFILTNGYPLVDELPEAWSRYQTKGLPLAILFVDKSADNADVIKTVTEAAEQVKGKFSFSFADGVRFKQQIERMGGDTEKLPSLAAMTLNGKANYPFNGELTASALADFAKGIVDGSVKPTLKSEEIPTEQANLVKVVGKTAQSFVDDKEKDTLLEIYAPWCGHCKSLQPVLEELAEKYASNDKVVIAQVDGTANDVVVSDADGKGIEYRGFPTLKFLSGGKVLDYEGGRTLDDFVKYIEANSKFAKADDSKDEL